MTGGVWFENLHPVCILAWFVGAVGLTLACAHPVMAAVSLAGAALLLVRLRGARAAGKILRFALPLFLVIAAANPLFNHRGVTYLFTLFDQWITLEAVAYGLVSGGMFSAMVLWFACWQAVMPADKFLYLFAGAFPSAALLVSMTLGLIPRLRGQLEQIRASQEMLREAPKRPLHRLRTAIRHLSTLLTWSMENAVRQADSMKARGYGLKKRGNFHLFHFDSRDLRFLVSILAIAGVCLMARLFGHGTMDFYPRMDRIITGESGLVTYGCFALLVLLPTALETGEVIRWRSYGLIR
jgi:energy-coupling factor transport system permease protein